MYIYHPELDDYRWSIIIHFWNLTIPGLMIPHVILLHHVIPSRMVMWALTIICHVITYGMVMWSLTMSCDHLWDSHVVSYNMSCDHLCDGHVISCDPSLPPLPVGLSSRYKFSLHDEVSFDASLLLSSGEQHNEMLRTEYCLQGEALYNVNNLNVSKWPYQYISSIL